MDSQSGTDNVNLLIGNDAKYFYYDHGPLPRTETGDLNVQGMDHAYTIQGWIKGVNSNALSSTTDIGTDGKAGTLNAKIGTDAFGYSLNYFVDDYKAIATLSPANNFIATTTNMSSILGAGNDDKSLYNGNISSMVTTIIDPDQINTPLPQLTAYKYDQLNRITKLDAYRNINPATNSWTSAATDNTYQERYSYDANGNIKTLSRNGNLAGSLEMDRLAYTYEGPALGAQYKKKTNRLNRVNDNATSGASYATDIENQTLDNYSYDNIGNLTKDNKEEIAEIKWTVYGKVAEVIRTGTSNKPNLEFRYDAAGNRIMKIVKPKNSQTNPAGWIKTYYAHDAGGNVMSTYEEIPTINTGHYTLAEQHIYGSSRTGMRSVYKDLVSLDMPAANTYARILGEKRFEGSNHLGNVLAVFSDRRNAVDLSKPNLIQSFDYYAFGMTMGGRTLGNNNSGYRYGFNGQEKESELEGDYFYKYRVHDPRIGRFLSIDPLAHQFVSNSPYAFAQNRVIDGIEFEGLEIVLVTKLNDETIWNAAQDITDKSAVHIIAHGNQRLIQNQLGSKIINISTSVQFSALLKTSDDYIELVKNGNLVVILHSCRTGRPITSSANGTIEPSFAQKMSKELSITVIAPDERDYFGYWGESGPQYTMYTDDSNRDYNDGVEDKAHGSSTGEYANWLVYTEGILTAVYSGKWSPIANPGKIDNLLYKQDLAYKVTAKSLNIRSGAGTEFGTLGKPLTQGTIMNPTGKVSKGWMEVITDDGITGWVNAKHSSPIYSQKPATK